MTTEPDPELTPDQESRLRRLLADARHDDPMPEAVVARLDAVLTALAAEDGAQDETQAGGGTGAGAGAAGTTSDLADRRDRRRRRTGALLLAAAAVVVGGVAVGNLGSVTGSGEDAMSGADDAGAGSSEAESEATAGRAGDRVVLRNVPSPVSTNRSGPVRIDPDDFADDVARVTRDARTMSSFALDNDETEDSPEAPQGPDGITSTQRGAAWPQCDPAAYGPGRLVPVRYDGAPAVLAVRPRVGDQRVVDLLQCGTGEVLRSVTLPTP